MKAEGRVKQDETRVTLLALFVAFVVKHLDVAEGCDRLALSAAVGSNFWSDLYQFSLAGNGFCVT